MGLDTCNYYYFSSLESCTQGISFVCLEMLLFPGNEC